MGFLRRALRTGAMIPGQLGPTMRVLPWVLSISVMRTMSADIRIVVFAAGYTFHIPC